jgi:glycosyltransferase involved in cell wall biosynthesis
MRILILVDNYYPSTKSVAKIMRDLALELARQGQDVKVAAVDDQLPQRVSVSREDGTNVLRVNTGGIKINSRALRAWRESRLSTVVWRHGQKFFRENPCDLILFYSPTIFFGALVNKLKALWNCPAFLVLQDIFPKWALDAGVLKPGLIYNYFRRKELEQYEAADLITVEAPGNLRYFAEELGHKNYRVEVLLNWTDMSARPSPDDYRLRRELGLEKKVVFFFGGNIGVAQDMDNVLRLAASVRDQESIFFLLVGSGSEVERLNAEITRQSLPNVRILPPVPQQQYLSCVAQFDVGLITLDRRLKSNNLTGKLLGYMQCGLPVLASLNPGNDLGPILRDSDAGIACENGDDEAFRAAALLLANNPDLRSRMGANARRLGEQKFSVQAAASQILSHFAGELGRASTNKKAGRGRLEGDLDERAAEHNR